LLVNNTEDGVRSLLKVLSDTKDGTATDMQKKVHRNYRDFIHISKVSIDELNVFHLTVEDPY
jgi:hypothetical protein